MTEFDHFKALSFDCYGTLIDWETGIVNELLPWAMQRGLGVDADELLTAFGAIETEVERDNPATLYRTILAMTLDRVAGQLGTTTSADERAAFGSSVGRWPAFADSPQALARLQQRFKLIILSNVDRASFAESQERLGIEFDLVITAEDVGSYKPSSDNFVALLDALPSIGVAGHELVHVAQSLYHDHEPAQAIGLPSVWIDRRSGQVGFGATPPPRSGAVSVDWQFTSMNEFADAAAPL